MKYVFTYNSYDFFVGDNGEDKYYNCILNGDKRPNDGFYSLDYVCQRNGFNRKDFEEISERYRIFNK